LTALALPCFALRVRKSVPTSSQKEQKKEEKTKVTGEWQRCRLSKHQERNATV
jgi:hypothetical protein